MLSINNVSYKDTQAFMDEVRLVVDNDWDRVTRSLIDWDRLGLPDDEDAYASLSFTEPVSWRTHAKFKDLSRAGRRGPRQRDERWHNYSTGRDYFRSKRKEVK
jgi:hypothetical protein